MSSARERAEQDGNAPKPLEALDWLQNKGGLTLQQAEIFKAAVRAGRNTKRGWWEN